MAKYVNSRRVPIQPNKNSAVGFIYRKECEKYLLCKDYSKMISIIKIMLSPVAIFPKKMPKKIVPKPYECTVCKIDFITLHKDVSLCNDCYKWCMPIQK